MVHWVGALVTLLDDPCVEGCRICLWSTAANQQGKVCKRLAVLIDEVGTAQAEVGWPNSKAMAYSCVFFAVSGFHTHAKR